MKKLKLLIVIAAAIFMSSCGSRDKISEVRLIPVKSGAEFQYIDRDGKIIINPQFRQATVFREGLALIQTSSDEPKWGFINEEGIYVIDAQYMRATVFSEGIAWVVSENAAPSAIDKKGDIKFTLQNAENVKLFKEGVAAYSIIDEDGYEKWGFVDKNGQVIINAQFYGVSNFSEGLCAVRNSERKWGFIDKEGKIIINPQFDGAQDFYKGRCIVVSGYRTGVIDKDGKYLINPQFDKMMYDGTNFLIEQDDRIGWCDKDGKIIINPQFSEALPFNNHKLAPVLSGQQWGYIDNTGRILINPQFDFALPFNGKLALVASNNKLGFINDEGRFVINPQFDDISIDFYSFVIGGSSYFESVETDYFNVEAIAAFIDYESPEGLTFKSTLFDIIEKFEIDENQFNRRGVEHEIIRSKKISNDANYSFFVLGKAFDTQRVQRGSGWYTYYDTQYVFNGNNKPDGYVYVINLTNRGRGKEDAVISAFEKKLSKYKEDDSDYFYYNNSKIQIYSNRRNQIVIIIEHYIESENNNNEVAI